MNPLEKIQQQMKIVKLIQEQPKRPLPTTFRSSYPVPLPIEVVELLRVLKNEYNQPVNERLERACRLEAIRMAQRVNRKLSETQENQPKGVDSQPAP